MTTLSRWNITLLAAGLVFSAGCHSKHEPTSVSEEPVGPPVTVRLATVQTKKLLATEEAVGTVRARLRATIEAKVSGRIVKLPVVAGQAVKKGDLLVQLDAQEVQAKLDQAKALLDQAQRDIERFRRLLEQKAVTQQEYDAVEARYRVAAASVEEAQTMLGYTTITAPFDGVVSRKMADVGDLAAPGKPLLLLEDPSALQVEADVSEALINRIKLGDALTVRAVSLREPLKATVSEIAPAADPNSRTFRVKLDLPPNAGLRLGQFVRVDVPVGETEAPRVPVSALVVRGQLEMVFVVTNRVARMRLVKTGKRVGGEIEILSGLQGGEQVVVEGAHALRDGQLVKLP